MKEWLFTCSGYGYEYSFLFFHVVYCIILVGEGLDESIANNIV